MATFPPEVLAEAFPELRIVSGELRPGGSKAVYQAKRGETSIALKILKAPISDEDSDENTEIMARFAREIDAMGRVESPHVVRVLDQPAIREIAGERYHWYSEPFFGGGDLKARVSSAGPWPQEQVLNLFMGLVSGVEAISSAGLVHRDIKPANIVFNENSAPVLLDMGVVLDTGAEALTSTSGTSPGTAEWCAPEQAQTRREATIDVRTDLFLVGLVSFYAWTGEHPFRPGETGYATRLLAGNADWDALPEPDSGLAHALKALLKPELHERPRTPGIALKLAMGELA